MDLETMLKDAETKMATLQASLAESNVTISNLKVEKEALTKQVESLTEANKKLDKDLSIERTNAQNKLNEADADRIKTEVLSTSSLKKELHEKVSAYVDTSKYLTEVGALDKEKFKAAFTAEVKDWEGRITSKNGGGLGAGTSKEDAADADATEKTEKKSFWSKGLGHDKLATK